MSFVVIRSSTTLRPLNHTKLPFTIKYLSFFSQIIHDSRPDATAFSRPQDGMPTVVTETAAALGLEPTTSREELARDLREDGTLHEAFHAQVWCGQWDVVDGIVIVR